ncbi:JAB domain-containing protein [Ruminococcus champanellensis]|uniref:JAB domain-containing protein n=1 Tax=Ruminococcus champanellensis TaxID=1161942 RepID=UPI0039F54A09
MGKEPAEQSLHSGHRDRMRTKFLQQGLEGFQEHEMLELTLFYALPRVNTNEVAHRLLQRFGSLADVLNADYHALRDVKGMGESSAMLLTLIAQLSRQYRLSTRKDLTLNTFDATCAYFKDIYLGEPEEQLRLACLDDRLRLMSCGVVSEGAPSSVPVHMRRLVEYALQQKSELVVLAHNHPNGTAMPSPEDIAATQKIFNVLKSVGIRLVDHIIVAGEQAVSLKEYGAFSLLD